MSRNTALHEWKVNTAIKKMIANIEATDTREIVRAIDTKMTLATLSEGESRSHRLDAGRMLLVLRKRIETKGFNWWKWHAEHFSRSRRDTERLLAMASDDEPEEAAKQAANRNRKYQAKHQAKHRNKNSDLVSRADDENSNVVPLITRDQPSADVRHIMQLIAELDDQQRGELWAACKEEWHGEVDTKNNARDEDQGRHRTGRYQ